MAGRKRLRLFSDSTRAWFAEARRTGSYSLFDLLHGYVYTRWPYLYIGIATGEHPLARRFSSLIDKLAGMIWPDPTSRRAQSQAQPVTFADTYHGKVMPLETARQLISVQQEIRLTNLETVIPYAHARDIILKNPDHIVALECPCRAARPNPCRPLDVCIVVGEPFASFVIEHHPGRAHWITQQEAAGILRAEHERGHVHHAFFKDAMLGRYYAICNCCSCCCGAMQAHRNGIPMLASSGYVSRVDVAKCRACGRCAQACPFGAIAIQNNVAVVDAACCMGCGVCVDRCEQGALSLAHDASRSAPLDIQSLQSPFLQYLS